jgi:ketosteroid isomerase-like protein
VRARALGSLDRPTLQESTGVPVCVTDERKVQVGQDGSHVVDRSYETWNSGNVDGLQELYAIDADVAIPGASAQGREQIGALWGAIISAFPDGRLTELLRLDCGGHIVSENNLSGTHTAPLVTPQGDEIPATGNSVSVDGVSIFKIENGEIQSEHLYFDQMTFLAQLGLIPPQPTT